MSNKQDHVCRTCAEWLSADGVKGRCAAGGIAGWVWRDEGCNRWWALVPPTVLKRTGKAQQNLGTAGGDVSRRANSRPHGRQSEHD